MKNRFLTVLLFTISILLLTSAPVWAASSNSIVQGITISPAYQQINIPQNVKQQSLTFTLINHRPVLENLQLYTEDFNALSESGGLYFVGINPTQLQNKYRLSHWLSLPIKNIVLDAGQTKDINLNIQNDSTLTPGGHYGALMLSLTNGSTVNAKNLITVHPVASSLLFVNKIGGDIHKLKLNNVEIKHSFWRLPSNVTLRFYNDGNTHLVPRGSVYLTNSSDKIVSQGIINVNSNILLPQLYRNYQVPLTRKTPLDSAGKYNLIVNYRFDGYNQFGTYRSTFILSSVELIAAILVITLMLIFAGLWMVRAKVIKPKRDHQN